MKPAERSTFTQLYDEHVWRVYGFFGYRVTSRAEAEDLTQLTFERALRAWDRFDPRRGAARTWLMAIARNLLIDHYRSAAGVRTVHLHEESTVERVERIAVTDPEPGVSPELADALGILGTREREVLALRFGGDLNGPEVAALTGLSVANVQQIFSRSLRKLRGHLGEPAAGERALARRG